MIAVQDQSNFGHDPGPAWTGNGNVAGYATESGGSGMALNLMEWSGPPSPGSKSRWNTYILRTFKGDG